MWDECKHMAAINPKPGTGPATLRGQRAEFVRVAKREIAHINRLPRAERDGAYEEKFGKGAVRALAEFPELAPGWLSGPSNRTVSFKTLVENPAPRVNQLEVEYELELPDAILLMQKAGVKGGDESGFRVDALLRGRRKGTVLFWAKTKKTRVVGTNRKRVGGGKISAPGTGRTLVRGPRLGKIYTLRGEGRSDIKIKVLDYNLKKAVLWAKVVT